MSSINVNVGGQSFVLSPIKVGEAKSLRGKFQDPIDFGIALVAASLRSGGNAEASEKFVEDMDYFSMFVPLIAAAREANGLVAASGEATAAEASPAA